MNKQKKRKKALLFAGLILIAFSMAVGVLLFSLKYDELWSWYSEIRDMLMKLEDYITSLDKSWKFICAIMLLYVIKSFFPIYFTSTVCLITGIVLPMWLAIPVNIVGITIQFTIKYFWGQKIGAGYAWKILRKNDTFRHTIQANGKGNPILLFAVRLVPGTPVNMVSSIYGSLDFGYEKFLALSLAGFLPKLISFTYAGTNMFDPLSPGFLIPVMAISFLTGVSLLGANGVWTAVDKVTRFISKRQVKNRHHKEKLAAEASDNTENETGNPEEIRDEQKGNDENA